MEMYKFSDLADLLSSDFNPVEGDALVLTFSDPHPEFLFDSDVEYDVYEYLDNEREQFDQILQLLKNQPNTRQAVLMGSRDGNPYWLTFRILDDRLVLEGNLGASFYDFQTFTYPFAALAQDWLADRLGISVGEQGWAGIFSKG